MRTYSFGTRFLVICLLPLLAWSCSKPENKDGTAKEQGAATEQSENRSNLGEAPDFEKQTLSGDTIRLFEQRDKIVLLNFWATWCAPCRREIPALIDLQEEFNEDLLVIGIALDEEGAEVVRPYAEEMGINYPIVMDDYSYGDKLGGVYVVPTTYIVDHEGLITARKVGEISIDDIRTRIVKLLDEQ